MKPINIYLSRKDKKELNEIKNKYHLSFSTIADILSYHYQMFFHENELQEKYIYGREQIKTSITPRFRQYSYTPTKKTVFYTNVLIMYLRKDTKNQLQTLSRYDQKLYTKFMNNIAKDLNETYDDNWNGNNMTRSLCRFIKKNKDYTRRLLQE